MSCLYAFGHCVAIKRWRRSTTFLLGCLTQLENRTAHCRLHLPFPDHVRRLGARQNDARSPEVLEAHYGFDNPLDDTMVLLNKIVQMLICRTLIGVPCSVLIAQRAAKFAPLLSTVTVSGTPLCSMAFSRKPVQQPYPMSPQQEINGLALLVNGSMQIGPPTLELDVCFIHLPALAHRPLALAKCPSRVAVQA